MNKSNHAILHELSDDVERFFGLKLGPRLLGHVLGDQRRKILDDARECGVDTCVREWAANVIGQYVVGKDWPTGATSETDTVLFFSTLYVRAPKMGIKVTREVYP